MEAPKFNFLKEKPLDTIEEISNSKFGHEEIALTLANISEQCPTPFTIGLFAKWGSGKSTIANSLKKKLLPKNIPVILFDIWKHEGDALRRTFLKEMVKQLKSKEYGSPFFANNFELNDRLERSVSTSSDTKLKVNYEKLKQFIFNLTWPVAILLICSLVLHHYGLFVPIFNYLKPLLLAFAGVTGSTAFIIWLLKQSVYFFSSETTSYGVDKFEDPHEFEEEFAAILKNLKNPRIVIVFDNLDRVTHDKVAEVLSTIKTFLEPADMVDDAKEVVFLVPCDALAIKHHLESLYDSTEKFTFDSDEFLRKFFSTIVWIPDFIPVELESLAKDSLQDTKVSILDDNNVAWLITKAFRENPRQIIQFVNILLANYLLVAERQGEKKDFPEDFLKENVSQLTKYLILNQLFPDEMEVLRKKKILNLKDVEKDDLSTSKKEEFLKFIDETKSIQIDNLGIFFTLRRSKQEKQFPGFGSFITLLEDRKTEDAHEYIDSLGDLSDPTLINNFSQAIKTEIENKTNPVSLGSLLATLFAVVNEGTLKLSDTLYKEVSHRLNTTCRYNLQLLPPTLVDSVLFENYRTDRQDIVSHWIEIVESMYSEARDIDAQFVTEVMNLLSAKTEYLNSANSLSLKAIVNSHFPNDIEVSRMISRSSSAQNKIGSREYITNFVDVLTETKLTETVKRLEALNLFDDTLTKYLLPDPVFKTFTKIVSTENTVATNDSVTKQSLLFLMNEFILKSLSRFSGAAESVISEFVSAIIASYSVIPDIEDKQGYMKILVDAKKYAPDAKIAEIDAILSTYVTTISPDGFDDAYNKLSKEDQGALFESDLLTPASKRSIKDALFRDKFYGKITDTQRQSFIVKLFQQNIEGAFEFVENLDSGEYKNIFEVFVDIWTVFDTASVVNKKRIFDFVNQRKADNNKNVREALADKISTCLTTIDPATQEMGLQGLSDASQHISQPLVRKIIQSTFDWVRKPEITPKYQPYSLRAVLLGIDQFNTQEKAEFLQFIFDELLRKSTDIVHISFGFELLNQLIPNYEDRTQNFEDIKLRIESEPNVDIKNSLLDGLEKIMPPKQTSANKVFWKWVADQKVIKE